MKVGDSWDCPHCKKNSFLKKESVMEGWTKVGEVLKCAACGAVAEQIGAASADGKTDTPAENKINTLAALLGEEKLSAPETTLKDAERRFCRDCKHRVMNAFRIYCTKHERDVNPMDDCPDYLPREKQEKEN